MIKLENINKSYYNKKNEKCVLSNINLTINDVGLYAIVGDNGSGKTTLLNIIGLLDKQTSGNIEIFNIKIDHRNKKMCHEIRNKYVSYIFQNDNLLNDFTVYENLKIVCDDDQEVLKVLNFLNLSDKISVDVTSLSGGEKQKLAIGRALLKNTPILLLDEITVSLDETSGKNIFELLTKISKFKIIILVTHDRKNALKYSDIVYELSGNNLNKIYGDNLNNRSPVVDLSTKSKMNLSFIIKYGFRLIKNKLFLFIVNVLLLGTSLFLLFVYLNVFKVNLTNTAVEALKTNDINNITVESTVYNENTNASVLYDSGSFLYEKYKKYKPNSYLDVFIPPKYSYSNSDNTLPVRIVLTKENDGVKITDFAYKYIFNEPFSEQELVFKHKISDDKFRFLITKLITTNFSLDLLNSYLSNSDYLMRNYDKLFEYNIIYIPIEVFKDELYESNLRLNAANFVLTNELQANYCNRLDYLTYKRFNNERIIFGDKIEADNEIIVSKKFADNYFSHLNYTDIIDTTYSYKNIYSSTNKNLYLDLMNMYEIIPNVKIVGIALDNTFDIIISDIFYNNIIDKIISYLDGFIFNYSDKLLDDIHYNNDKISLKLLSPIYDYTNVFNSKTNVVIKALSLVLSLLAICSLLTFTIVSLKSKYKDIGILLSIGKNKFNISLLYIIQILSLVIISLIISWLSGTIAVKMINNYLVSPKFYNINYNIIVVNNYSVFVPIILVSVVVFISYSLSLLQIFNKKIINLLKDSF